MVTDNLLSFLLYGILIFRVVLLSVFHYFFGVHFMVRNKGKLNMHSVKRKKPFLLQKSRHADYGSVKSVGSQRVYNI